MVTAYIEISAHILPTSHRSKKGENKTIHNPCLQHNWKTGNVTNFSLHVSGEQASKAVDPLQGLEGVESLGGLVIKGK